MRAAIGDGLGKGNGILEVQKDSALFISKKEG
ncbi:MAG: hypothetical protein JWP99_327 [Devosia sp.]|nr:hypothetical protein [Devosia sp.]